MSTPLPSERLGCLDEAVVQRLAAGTEPDESAAALHAQTCPSCNARVAEARIEADFLGRARGLLGDDLGPIGAPRLAGYRPLGVISTGAQGVVYRARQETTQRTVAIKVLAAPASGTNSQDGHGTASATRRRLRAEREVEIIARLSHPNIVAVHESRVIEGGPSGSPGSGPGRVALVMEYVDGVPLDQWQPSLGPGAGSDERLAAVLRVFVQVCSAVHHAHLNGVIHRDLKPDNILVTPAPEGRPVVLDFGIAKINDLHGRLRATATGDFAGTPAYASPEQVAGKPDDIDALTDVYSLGVILYRLVCNRLPYDLGDNIFEAARVIGNVQPVPPRSVNPSLPRDLDAVVMRALAKSKPERYQSAAALSRDVERFLDGQPVEARSHSGWYMLRKAVSANRARLLPAGLALGVLLAAGAAVAISLRRAADASSLAEQRREQAKAEHARARSVSELLRATMPTVDARNPQLSLVIGRGLTRLYFRLETGAYANDPAVESDLRRLWGGVYTELSGKAFTAVEYAEISLRIGLVRSRQAHPGDHPETASFLHQLAGVLLVRSRPHEALVEAGHAVEMRRRLQGDNSMQLAESLIMQARAQFATGDLMAAKGTSTEAIRILKPRTDPPSLLLASAQETLARVAMQQGDSVTAEPLLHDALITRLTLQQIEDPEVLSLLSDAVILSDAAPDAPMSLHIRRTWASRDEFDKDMTLLREPNRGDYFHPVAYGRTDALKHTLALQEALLGSDNPAILSTLLLLADTAYTEVRFTDRAASSLRAARMLGKRFGPRHTSVPICLQDASVALAFSGEYAQAITLARETIAFWDAIEPYARDPLLAANSHRYLLWYMAMSGDAQATLEHGPFATEQFSAAVGPTHHTTAFCEALTAWAALRTGDWARADRLSARALAAMQSNRATPADFLAHALLARGLVLLEQPGADNRQMESARALIQKAWDDVFSTTTSASVLRTECVRSIEPLSK